MAGKKLPVVTMPIRIADDEFYTLEVARQTLKVSASCLRRDFRLGRLRYSKRGGRVLIPGPWLREYIFKGEAKRRDRPVEPKEVAA